MDQETQKALFPGVPITLECEVTVKVYPMGFRHVKKFSRSITNAMSALGTISWNAPETELGAQIAGLFGPYVLENMIDLVFECCEIVKGENEPDIKLEQIPHWELPAIIEVWLKENFGEPKKWKPWVQTIESAVRKATGKDLSITDLLSKLSSKTGTDSKTSSTEDTTEPRIAAGAS